jgi:hypothetical protein
MPAYFEVWEIKPIEVGGIDVGGPDSAVGPDLLG